MAILERPGGGLRSSQHQQRKIQLEMKGQKTDYDEPDLIPRGLFFLTTANEFNTSQRCPRCHEQTDFYTRPSSGGKAPAEILRLKKCSRCEIIFHRDGMAATSLATIGLQALLNGSRPTAFCDPEWMKQKERAFAV
jgi:Putative transposase DNA-binding domain